MWSRRNAERSASPIAYRSRPSTRTRPESGGSRPPMMGSRALLPAPLCPMMATNSPVRTVKETLSRIMRGGRLIWKLLDTESRATTAGAAEEGPVAGSSVSVRASVYLAALSATLVEEECFQGRLDGVGDEPLPAVVVGGQGEARCDRCGRGGRGSRHRGWRGGRGGRGRGRGCGRGRRCRFGGRWRGGGWYILKA